MQNQTSYHCPVCNRLTKESSPIEICPYCNSPYIHVADESCLAMTFKEHGGNVETSKNNSTDLSSIPDATGNSSEVCIEFDLDDPSSFIRTLG